MSVDWTTADPGSFMDSGHNDFPYPGGQYLTAVPISLAQVRVTAALHTDSADGARYVSCGGTLNIPPASLTDPGSFYPAYWPYRFTGWPVLAAIPGDLFNAEISGSDPVYEGGGKYIESAMVGKYDPDWPGPYAPGFPPTSKIRAGNEGRGGHGHSGVEDEADVIDPDSSLVKIGWTFKAVSQRCWVLIVIDPSAHRFFYDPNPPDPVNPPWPHTGDPIVVTQTPALSQHRWEMYWKHGAGSGIPANGDDTGFSGSVGDTPSDVTVGPAPLPGTGGTDGEVWTQAELEALAAKHGAPDPHLASAVAMAESGGQQDAQNVNDNGSVDTGLWQINSIHGIPIGVLLTADGNAEAARTVSNDWTDWTPWVTYNSGAYLDFM